MPVDLDGVRFVTAPAVFPRLPYHLVRDDRVVPETFPLLTALAPHAAFRGFVAPDAPAAVGPGAVALVSSPDWPAVVARLRRHLPADRVAVLLNPGDYPWGYLEVARAAPDRVAELADPAVPVREKAGWLARYLVRYADARFEAGRPGWNPEHYFLPYRGLVRENAAAVHDVTAALADPESRAAYHAVLYGTPEQLLEYFLSRVFRHQQYVELARLRPGDVVVNAGVADGWDVPYLLAETRGRGRHLLVDPVEPAPGTAAADLRRAFGLEYAARGLWDRDEPLEFPVDEAGMVDASRPGERLPGRPTAAVRCGRLDDLVREAGLDRVDLIKMDIEGAEPRALAGMADTLRRFRPQLAVCVYHRPEHMWTIPAGLMAALPDYRFFVRHYSPVRFECVFYAIPAERLADAGPAGDALDRAGVDGDLVRRAWAAAGADRPLDAELARHAPADAARAADAELGRLLAAAPAGRPVVQAEVPVAGPDFTGSGWGPTGWDRRYAWRWLGPDGTGSVFLPLDRRADYRCRLYLFQSDGQEVLDALGLEVNGAPAADREFGWDGDHLYAQWRVPADPADPTPGLSRLRFHTAPGPRRLSVSRVNCWRA